MHISELRQVYTGDPLIQSIGKELTRGTTSICLEGLIGSADAFMAYGIFENTGGIHVFIFADREDAVYFLNDMESLIGSNENVLYFPGSGKTPYRAEDTDNANVLMRAEVLNKLGKHNKSAIVVTTAEGLAEKVVTRKHLEKNTLDLEQGKNYSVAFIDEVLLEYEFEKVDFVYQPGQFSIRGGIVDIFSFSNEDPYRIEFFGDEVESIRSFDTITQLSKQKMARISIVPNVQEKILRESRETFLDFIPSGSILWISDAEVVAKKMDKEFDRAQKAFDQLQSSLLHLQPGELYCHGEDMLRQLIKFSWISFRKQEFLQAHHHFEFKTSPQPVFSKNFDLLAKNLNENHKLGYKNIILAEQSRQVERLYTIFEDKQKEVELSSIKMPIRAGFVDHRNKLAVYTDHQIFERYHRFKLKEGFNKTREALTLKDLLSLQKGDFVTHIDHGIGQYSGLEKIEVNGKHQEAIRLIYKGGDVLYVSIHSLHRISKYTGKEGSEPSLNKLGTNNWQTLKQKTKKKVKEIAFDLIQLYAKRKSSHGFAYHPDNYLQTELEASFMYEDTPDQLKATIAVKKDMEAPYPMDRLVCGDVGFGKTEIAMRAAFKAVCDSKQVAVLCPTTLLALQHYKNFKERFKDFPCKVDYINRFKSTKSKKETLEKLQRGEIDVLIGTHAIVGKDVKFKDLGLLIIDEEQKFGVSVKDKLKLLRENVDTLTLTATPIPRTLQFSLMGARDLSIIATPPPNRHPVQTEISTFHEEIIRDRIMYEVSRGGQVFFVHNKVQNIQEIAGLIQRICPEVKICVGHGQMEGDKLEEVMMDFIEGEYDVLVATAIVESGIDISNANTILINDAHNFGLSDLHQLRGRVGRSNKRAFCVLLTQPMHTLTQEARKRLQAIEQFSDLGSGFNIAMRDLDIRGAGNLLGGEQSGFISDIGYETYQKILDEAIQELKETEFKDLYQQENEDQIEYVRECTIETDLELLIPDDYVNNVNERLILYRELDDLKNEHELEKYRLHLIDRFGVLPPQTEELLKTIRLRWLAKEIGFERLILKFNRLVGYFIAKEDSPYFQSTRFSRVLKFIQSHHQIAKMEEKNGKLQISFQHIRSVNDAIEAIEKMMLTEDKK
ncbi:MAG: transcription-repair coupling factor [Flavobacteriales bacterium]|nr:transcription-repair coupling factor [Flavobacteriales bacterium]